MYYVSELEHPKMQESLKQLIQAMNDIHDNALYQLLIAGDAQNELTLSTH